MTNKVCVLGCGSWGTALANHLASAGHTVLLWGNEPEVIHSVNTTHTNSRYFPNIPLHPTLRASLDLEEALRGAQFIVSAIPSIGVPDVAHKVRPYYAPAVHVITVTKGLEEESLRTMSEVWTDELGASTPIAALSGPSFAAEVVRGQPTAVTVAGEGEEVTRRCAALFHAGTFRVYTSGDIKGVQLCGAVKNVIALATGMLDGLNMGANARAALITRGLAEISRLVGAAGGDPQTAVGLSGLGDLLLTCTGDLSRNRQVGLRLGHGEGLSHILADLGQVAEGVLTTKKVLALAHRHGVMMPIAEEVFQVLEGTRSVQESVNTLLARAQRRES